jgi:hypothetical protein
MGPAMHGHHGLCGGLGRARAGRQYAGEPFKASTGAVLIGLMGAA